MSKDVCIQLMAIRGDIHDASNNGRAVSCGGCILSVAGMRNTPRFAAAAAVGLWAVFLCAGLHAFVHTGCRQHASATAKLLAPARLLRPADALRDVRLRATRSGLNRMLETTEHTLGYPSVNRFAWQSLGTLGMLAIPAIAPPPLLMPPVPPPSSLGQLGEGHSDTNKLAIAELHPLRQAAAHRCQALLPAATDVALADELLLQADRGMLDARILGDALWTVSASQDPTSKVRRLLPVITERLLGRAADLDGHGVASALWAAAVFREDSPVVLAMLPVLIERLIRTLHSLEARDASLAFVALAALREELGRCGLKLSRLADALAERLIAVTVGTDIKDPLEPWLLSNVLWALALSGLGEDRLAELVPLIAAHAAERSNELEPQHVATMLWAAATLRGVGAGKQKSGSKTLRGVGAGKQKSGSMYTWDQTASSSTKARALAALLVGRLQIVADRMAPVELTMVLWALGVCFGDNPRSTEEKVMRSATSASMLDGIHVELACALDSVGALDLSLAVWGLAALEYRNKELLEVAAERAVALEPETQTKILAVAVPRMVWAFARLHVLDTRLLRMTAAHFESAKNRLWYMRPGSICALLWAYERHDLKRVFYDFAPPLPPWLSESLLLQQALSAKLEEYLERPIQEGAVRHAISVGQCGPDLTVLAKMKPTRKPSPEVFLEERASVWLNAREQTRRNCR